MAPQNVRVRFAPSPTGSLHVGGARTALFNFLFARGATSSGAAAGGAGGGRLILRIEDTDEARHQESALQSLMRALQWLGLDWDEGPESDGAGPKGDFGPYRQSLRLPIYKEMAQKLLSKGCAYRCFLTVEDEAALKKKLPRGRAFVSPFREMSENEAHKTKPFTLRFKTPRDERRFEIQDQIRGAVSFPLDSLSDFVLLRADGSPVYNFAAAVDDALMRITHVFRGEEHLPNTLQQIFIQKALGFAPPQYGHLSIILDERRKKLSKRDGAENVEHFKEEGFLPEALLNFLSLLGWNPGSEKEIFSLKELLKIFSIKRVHKAAAVFDQKKLLWLNSEHLRRLSAESFYIKAKPFLEEDLKTAAAPLLSDPLWREKAFELLKPGFKTLKEAARTMRPLLKAPSFNEESRKVFNGEKARLLFQRLIEELSKTSLENSQEAGAGQLAGPAHKELSKASLGNSQEGDPWPAALALKAQLKLSGKEFFKPLRWAFLGKGEGLELKAIFQLLPASELCRRLQKALEAQ